MSSCQALPSRVSRRRRPHRPEPGREDHDRPEPIPDTEIVEAYRANALFDAHWDDPEFDCRFIADEAEAGGQAMCVRTAWRICSDNSWWSAFGRPEPRTVRSLARPSTATRVKRDFTATATNELWPTDITEHKTAEGKLYLRAI